MIRIYLVVIQFFILLLYVNGQVPVEQLGSKNHFDSLRSWLTLDIPLKSDSTFVLKHTDEDYTFHINKKRPKISTAIKSIQELINQQITHDTVLARLTTLLYEMDVRYLSEFAFSIDFYQNIYHQCHPFYSPRAKKELTELDVIKELELTIQFFKIFHENSSLILDMYLGDLPEYLSKEKYYSHTFKSYGNIDISIYKKYLISNIDEYYPLIKLRTEKDMEKSQVFRIFHLIGFFKNHPRDRMDCQTIEKITSKKSSKLFFSSLEELNQKWYKQDCVTQIINNH